MIHYDLRCAGGHHFDGWFRSSAAFDQQAQAGLLDCPVCASTEISRAIMSPRLATGATRPPAAAASPEVRPPAGPAAEGQMSVRTPPAMPDQVRALLQRIRAEVEQRCENVGPRFADLARAMHEGATAPRPIYGDATQDQVESLAEDGIAVTRIPWVPRADG
jgi:hypothetical protein